MPNLRDITVNYILLSGYSTAKLKYNYLRLILPSQRVISSLALVLLLLITLPGYSDLKAEVFQFDQQDTIVNILLFGSLDLYNNIYNQDNVDPLSATELALLSKQDVNVFDRWSIQRYKPEYDRIGTLGVLATLGSSFYYSVYDEPYTWNNILVLSEILAVQSAVTHWTKTLTLRNRPYLYDAQTDEQHHNDIESRMSFYSYHSSTAFSVAVYNHYYQHHSVSANNRAIWLGYSLAAASSLSRVVSGKHYPSDVIIGAASGSLISYIVCRMRSSKSSFSMNLNYRSIEFSLTY